jgi:CubicO group peptidase (beta-lactamase class C family)
MRVWAACAGRALGCAAPELEIVAAARDDAVPALATLPDGATLRAPPHWRREQRGATQVFETPQGTMLALSTLPHGDAADIRMVLAAESAAFHAELPCVFERWELPPAVDGWDERIVAHHRPASGCSFVRVEARRKAETWYVVFAGAADGSGDARVAAHRLWHALEVPGTAEPVYAGSSARPFGDTEIAALEDFVDGALRLSGIPGAAFVVVSPTGTQARGIGSTAQRAGQPVTPATLFRIGSMSKPLTTLMLARRVGEGSLAWDTPIPELPAGALAGLQVQHLVCACMGFKRWDPPLVFEPSATQASTLAHALQPRRDVGIPSFGYSNLAFTEVSHALHGAGTPAAFRVAIESEVLAPLGMSASTFATTTALARAHADPHALSMQLTYVGIAHELEAGLELVLPAGGGWSNAHDLGRYLAFELARGVTADGDRLVSEAALVPRWTPYVAVHPTQSYGLGLQIDAVSGVVLVGHGGDTRGYTSDVFFLPEHGIGAALLLNGSDAAAVRSAFRRRFLELAFGGSEDAQALLEHGIHEARVELATSLQPSALAPAELPEGLGGTYRNFELGELRISTTGMTIEVDAGEWRSRMRARLDAAGTTWLIFLDPPLLGERLKIAGPPSAPQLLYGTAAFRRAP